MSEEEYRFLTELKRVAGDASLINDDSVTGFAFGNYKVIFENGEIKLFGQVGMLDHCRINDFIRSPNAQFRAMKGKMTFHD